jgi:hypothetical protein
MENSETAKSTADPTTWAEHLARAAEAFAREMRGSVPEEFTKHARSSVKEGLLAMRSLLDAGISRIDRVEREKTVRRVPVE